MRRLALVLMAGCGSSAHAVENNSAPPAGLTLDRVSRDVLIDADHSFSRRHTYDLHIAAGRARLVSTLETNAVAHLDAWPDPWKLVHRTELTGTATQSGDRILLRLSTADGVHTVELTCAPHSFNALAPGARLGRAGDLTQCVREPRGTWTPDTKSRVDGLSCVRDGEETDPIEPIVSRAPLDFVEGGMEWVDENNACFLQGQGYRRLQ
jgi:hypothetical protein